jgi:hypothetical protein
MSAAQKEAGCLRKLSRICGLGDASPQNEEQGVVTVRVGRIGNSNPIRVPFRVTPKAPLRFGDSPAPNADCRVLSVSFFGHSGRQVHRLPQRPTRCAPAPRPADEDNGHDGVYGGTTTRQRRIMVSRTESISSARATRDRAAVFAYPARLLRTLVMGGTSASARRARGPAPGPGGPRWLYACCYQTAEANKDTANQIAHQSPNDKNTITLSAVDTSSRGLAPRAEAALCERLS